MSTIRWRGDAPAVAQIQTITIGVNDVATTYKATINGKTISVPGNASGASATATDLLNALKAATVPQEFNELVWTVTANIITGTASKPGRPVTLAVSAAGGTGTISTAVTNAGSGPNDVSVAAANPAVAACICGGVTTTATFVATRDKLTFLATQWPQFPRRISNSRQSN
jgi:hypothetical protein